MTDSRRGPRFFWANAREAAANLYDAKQRSFLALVGIVIGVSSVIALVSVGEIVHNEALKQFEALGTDVLNVTNQTHSRNTRGSLTVENAEGLASLDALAVVSAYTPLGAPPVQYSGKQLSFVRTVAATSSWLKMFRVEIESGRFISDLDREQPYCVVGANVAGALRRLGAREVVGESLLLNTEVVFGVIGVLAPAQISTSDFQIDDAIVVSLPTAARRFGSPFVRNIGARIRAGVYHLDAVQQVRNYLGRVAKDAKVAIETARSLIEQMQKQSKMFTLMLGAIGSISLVVGGIGIMNVMLVSVAERRLEIGIRRALGARRQDIQTQFLTEAVILSLCGGAVGVGVGIGVAYAISVFSGWTFLVATNAVVLGAGTATLVGVVFGYVPAHQAARLDTIAVLRGH